MNYISYLIQQELKMTVFFNSLYVKLKLFKWIPKWLDFIIIWSGLSWIRNITCKSLNISIKFIRNVKSRIYSLPINLHKHLLYLLEQHSGLYEIWSAIKWIHTEGKNPWLWHWAQVHCICVAINYTSMVHNKVFIFFLWHWCEYCDL